MLRCVVVGMGISLVPLSVLTTFPERKHPSVHPLSKGDNHYGIDLIWRKQAVAPQMIQALAKALKSAATAR